MLSAGMTKCKSMCYVNKMLLLLLLHTDAPRRAFQLSAAQEVERSLDTLSKMSMIRQSDVNKTPIGIKGSNITFSHRSFYLIPFVC